MNAMTDMALAERVENTSTANLVLNAEHMHQLIAFADIMASGTATVPRHLRKNRGDCLAVTIQAAQWKMNPFAVAQKTHLVNDTLGYEAQLVISVINNSPALSSRISWEWFGPWEKIVGKFKEVESKTKKDDDGFPKKYIVPDWKQTDEQGLGVRASATLRGESTPRVLEILMTQARTRNSTLWADDPKQQLAYLAAKRWARLHAPDVLLGVYTPDELEEIRPPVHMGVADEVLPPADAPAFYAEEGFRKNLPAWRELITTNKKTAEQVIATVEKKAPLTEEQKAAIRGTSPAETAPWEDAQPPATQSTTDQGSAS